MKECRICKEEKGFNEYYKRSTSKDGLYTQCKSCLKIESMDSYSANRDSRVKGMRELYKSSTSSYYTVYFIPEYNYIGVTNNLSRRVLNHKNNEGRVFSEYSEVSRFNSKEEALYVEYQLHCQGFNGKHPRKL